MEMDAMWYIFSNGEKGLNCPSKVFRQAVDLYKNNKELLRFNQNFNVYVIHEHAAKEQLLPYLKEISVMKMFFHELYEKGKQDGTIKTDLTEEKMFASTVHIMLAVGVRYSEGLLYSSENETDNIKEFEFLKKIMLRISP